jgi:hypothetical protein
MSGETGIFGPEVQLWGQEGPIPSSPRFSGARKNEKGSPLKFFASWLILPWMLALTSERNRPPIPRTSTPPHVSWCLKNIPHCYQKKDFNNTERYYEKISVPDPSPGLPPELRFKFQVCLGIKCIPVREKGNRFHWGDWSCHRTKARACLRSCQCAALTSGPRGGHLKTAEWGANFFPHSIKCLFTKKIQSIRLKFKKSAFSGSNHRRGA